LRYFDAVNIGTNKKAFKKKMVVVMNGKKEKDREGERKEEIKGRVVDRMGAVGV